MILSSNSPKSNQLFPALLKYWRKQRGLSQLDLALAADVSARHISFLETGRAQPSEEMLLRLATTLNVPLRNQNEMLSSANFLPRFTAPNHDTELSPAVDRALRLMMAQHEPFPIFVMNLSYDVLRISGSTRRLLAQFVKEPDVLTLPLNPYRLLFDPHLLRPAVVNWEKIARDLLSRLHREALHHPEKVALREMVEEIESYPDVPIEWRQPDFSTLDDAAYAIHFRTEQMEVAFLTTITTFSSPGNITLEELRIESYFPLDEETERICYSLVDK
ncbi:MAG: helix-turn-helix transcriptional regulator [Chloroflexota bacterium]